MSKSAIHGYEFGPFRLDAAEHLLLRDGEALPLTSKAFDLPLALVDRILIAGAVRRHQKVWRLFSKPSACHLGCKFKIAPYYIQLPATAMFNCVRR
jgi:hypothetical protein